MSALTLFTDASHCPSTRSAGYGAWAKSDRMSCGVFLGGGLAPCGNSSEAEIAAIAVSLVNLRFAGRLDGISRVMIQADNLRALELIVKEFGATISNHMDGCAVEYRPTIFPSPHERKSLDAIKLAADGISLIVRHVRGHSRNGSRSYINMRCDSIANRHMRQARGR